MTNLRYTLHLASSAEFSKMERGQSKIAPWRFLVSAFGLSYQRYHCFWKICINTVLDLLFVRVVSHGRQDVSICNRVDDVEKILSGIQSRRISGLRPLYSSWGALKIYVYEYKYILMYICTHIHILLTCVYTYTESAWVNFYKISSTKASGYYFTDGWRTKNSLCARTSVTSQRISTV